MNSEKWERFILDSEEDHDAPLSDEGRALREMLEDLKQRERTIATIGCPKCEGTGDLKHGTPDYEECPDCGGSGRKSEPMTEHDELRKLAEELGKPTPEWVENYQDCDRKKGIYEGYRAAANRLTFILSRFPDPPATDEEAPHG